MRALHTARPIPQSGPAASIRSGPALPAPRGPLSEAVVEALRRSPGPVLLHPSIEGVDVLSDDDAQLALATCYELHYRSFAGVDDRWEWAPELLAVRGGLEQAFVRRLEDEIGAPEWVQPRDVVPSLVALADGAGGRSVSKFIESSGRIEHLREFCVHRSAYQLKEADPHTFMIPRLTGRAKAAVVAIQYGEYGNGCVYEMHSELFATTMRALGLDSNYGAYLDALPGSTLATGNLVTMFGLHRFWRAACVGHLALFEMTSVGPMGRYANALRRFGLDAAARRFYDVHVLADGWHERLAQEELVDGLLESEPDTGGMVLFGARALTEVERRMGEALLTAWATGAPSLRAHPSRSNGD
jgi:hypothetical protein